MDNKIWGPYFWFTLHTVSLGYPNNPTYINKRNYNDFFLSLQNVLPCKLCQQHYREHLYQYPIASHLDNKDALVKWCFNLHNKVNISLNKPEFTYEEFIEKYRKIYSPNLIEKIVNTNHIDKYKNYKIVFLIIFIIIISGSVYFYYYKRKAPKYFFSSF